MSQQRILEAAVKTKTVIVEGLDELQEWIDDGMIHPYSANLIESRAQNYLIQLSSLTDIHSLHDVVQDIVESYEIDIPLPPDAQLDPVQECLYKHRDEILRLI